MSTPPLNEADPFGLIERLAVVVCSAGFKSPDTDPDVYFYGLSVGKQDEYRHLAAQWLGVMRHEGWLPMPMDATDAMCAAVADRPRSFPRIRRLYNRLVNNRPPLHWL